MSRSLFCKVLLGVLLSYSSSAKSEVNNPVESLILVGDAGASNKTYIRFLQQEAEKTAATTVVFLGDNVYPRGIPSREDPTYDQAKKLLMLQAKPFINSTARAFFVPGNHDWADSKSEGWDNVRNEETLLAKTLGTGTLRPSSGCPGPDVIHNSKFLYVIAVDSMWFLHKFSKPTVGNSECQFSSEEQFSNELKRLVNQRPAGASLVIVHHHPLASSGHHAVETKCPNSMGCPAYQRFIEIMYKALEQHPAFICAAGHEHTLEVRESPSTGCRWGLVSGTGSYTSKIYNREGARYVESVPGFMRVDFFADGRKKLTVLKAPTGEVLFEQVL
jgi:hypothetical protein